MTTSTTPRRSKTRRKPPPPTAGDAKGEEPGRLADEGYRRCPVCWVGMAGDARIKDVNRAMLSSFVHAGTTRGPHTEFGDLNVPAAQCGHHDDEGDLHDDEYCAEAFQHA